MIIEIGNKTFTELNDNELATVCVEGTVMILVSDSYTNGKRFKISRFERFGHGVYDTDVAFKAYTHTIELARQVADLVEKSQLPDIEVL